MQCNAIPKVGMYFSSIQQVDDKIILVSKLEPYTSYTLNSTGKEVWDAVEKDNCSIDTIASKLSKQYGISYENALKDTLRILYKLWKNGFVTWTNGENPFDEQYVDECANNWYCRKLTIDNMSLMRYTGTFLLRDAFLAESDLSEDINNTRMAQKEIFTTYILEDKKHEQFASLTLRVDHVYPIVHILQLSYDASVISSDTVISFISHAVRKTCKINSDENSVPSYLVLITVSSQAQLPNTNAIFTQVGVIPHESKSGDVFVYALK